MKLIDWIDLPNLGDERGGLVVAEASKNIPFKVNRIYYISMQNQIFPAVFMLIKSYIRLHSV